MNRFVDRWDRPPFASQKMAALAEVAGGFAAHEEVSGAKPTDGGEAREPGALAGYRPSPGRIWLFFQRWIRGGRA